MESLLTLTAAIAGAAWIAGEAWLCRRRLREAERLLREGRRLLATHDAELERHARIIVSLHAAQHADHREIAIDRIRIDRLDRARTYYPGRHTEIN